METPMTTATNILPADWDLTDPTTWTIRQTVDAHLGYHATGLVVRALQHIRLVVTDLDDGEDAAALAAVEVAAG